MPPGGVALGYEISGHAQMRRAPGEGGKTIVTVLCDSGTRYLSKLFNPEFLREKDLPVPAWL